MFGATVFHASGGVLQKATSVLCRSDAREQQQCSSVFSAGEINHGGGVGLVRQGVALDCLVIGTWKVYSV